MTKTEVQFFGFQLIEFLIARTKQQTHQPNKHHKHHKHHKHQLNDTVKPVFKEERIIRFAEVKKMVGLSRTTIWRKQQTGDFPQSIPLGINSVGWYKSEIIGWINNRK